MRIDSDSLRRALRRVFNRRVGLVSGLMLAGAVGLLAFPSLSGDVAVPQLAACCTGATAVGDAMITPSNGADKDFFEVTSSPSSVIFLIGNNESMMDFPQYLPEVGNTAVTGCTDPALVDAMKWFDRTSTDPAINGSMPFDPDSEFTGSIEFFNPSEFYVVRGRRLAVNGSNSPDYPYSLEWNFRDMVGNLDAASACHRAMRWSGWGNATHLECQSCLTTKGWWRGNVESNPTKRWDTPPLPPEATRQWVVSGRVLNVRPPKFVIARKVVKDVIDNVDNLRIGTAVFGPDRGWYDPPVMKTRLRPACNYSFPIVNNAELNKPLIKQGINQIRFVNNERSVGEALMGLGLYFSSEVVDGRWTSWFKQPLSPGFGWPGGWNGGTTNHPDTGQPGAYWGYDAVEWTKRVWDDTVLWEYEAREGSGYDKSVCFPCQANAVIVLTDGEPKYDNTVPITKMMEILIANKAKHTDGTGALVTFDSSSPMTNLNSGGINYCHLAPPDPVTGKVYTKADCDYTDWNWPHGHAVGNKNFMDDVAFFLANSDLRGDMDGKQSVTTYTIGYGDNSAMLTSIAKAGNGDFYPVGDPAQLREAIMEILGKVKQVSTSFSSANISGVQAGGMQSSAFVPRFTPRRKRPYEGQLFRYFLYSEFSQGCEPVLAQSQQGDSRDLNNDKDCNDTFFLDSPAGYVPGSGVVPSLTALTASNIVQENADGVWVKVSTATVDSEGKLVGGDPAQPYWNFGDTVGARSASAPCNRTNPLDPTSGRCIFTMVDRDNDGKYTASDNPPVEFIDTPESLALLKQHVLAAGDGFCLSLFVQRGMEVWTGTAAQQDSCVKLLVQFVRGVDVFDYDKDSNNTEDRPCADNLKGQTKSCKLADIFHSTPVTVDPPVESFLCDLGLHPQCLATLYKDFTERVSTQTLCASGSAPCYAPTPMNPTRGNGRPNGAYDSYRELYGKRERIALVGSNGGMLHAIHVGTALASPKQGFMEDSHDFGTGQEMWAFIPPDLLPKLGLMVNPSLHEFYVDGTPMVRDIWVDGAASGATNGVKEPEEFRTVAVIVERSGGQRFSALDVTDPREMLKVDGKPFRWMFPNACAPESGTMGQAWSNYTPRPPPIGAVRLKSSTDPRGWEERWIAFLNGGYSLDLSRGRGVYMLDAWTGHTLWSVEGRPGLTGGNYKDQVLDHMMPIAASPAMVDIGKAEDVRLDADGFFDTMVVGDLGGQAWTFRFYEPGELDAQGRVTNWFAARSLEMSREEVTSAKSGRKAYQKMPFYQIASSVRQPETGWLRAFMGTGDRQNLRDKEEKSCGPDNLLACLRMKCDVSVSYSADINGQKRDTVLEYKQGVLVNNTDTRSGTLAAMCTTSKMELKDLYIYCPDATTLGSGSTFEFPLQPDPRPDPRLVIGTDSECKVSGGLWQCGNLRLPTESHAELTLGADADLVPRNRYFGFHAYGGWKRRFNDGPSAIAFDALRVTDSPDSSCGAECALVDVTIPDTLMATYTDASGKTVSYLPATKLEQLQRGTTEGPGWFIKYGSINERTAAGSAVLAGVVFWPSFAPPAGGAVSACALSGAGDMSASWQADVITGLPDMSEGFRLRNGDNLLGYLPNKASPTSAPPGDPAAVVSLSKTGGIRYEVTMTPPGEGPKTEQVSDRRNVTPEVYWLEVPRNVHECRHENAQACSR